LQVTGWVNETNPALGETPLQLWGGENARCLAIDAAGGRLVLGADWSLHAFDAEGKPLWLRGVPDSAYAVNITADRRLVVAAYGDGTVRWHRLEDGAELLALFPMVDRENWVAWTPEGIYAASQKALRVLRWHRNRGWDAAGKDYPVADIPESHRPEVISLVVPQLDEIRALGVANMMQIRNAVQRVTGADVKTGARLHVLAIGVSDYGDAARHLDLQFAHFDARDVATALKHSQSNLYAEVLPIQLLNGDATKDGIIAGLNTVRRAMEAGGGHDLAVVLFSGHGEVVDDSFFLMPHGVDDSTPDKIEATALPIGQFHDKIAAIAERGRVIVLLDACRSGKATGLAQRSLRALLTAANVTVFTSSSDKQLSVERTDWQNGAFCEALLEALSKADFNRDTRIGVNDLALYLGDRVPALTGGTQCPDVEFRGTDIQVFEVGV
jgi:hypothetical protein